MLINTLVVSFCKPGRGSIKPLALDLDIYILAHHLCKMSIFYEPRSNIRKYMTFCGGINEDSERKSKKIN